MRYKLIMFLSVFGFLVIGCATPTCAEQTEEYRQQVIDISDRWDDANELAGSTARMSLSEPISQLQAIRREVNDLEVPECAQKAHDALITYMDSRIDLYLTFLSDADADLSEPMRLTQTRFETWELLFAQLLDEE